MPIKDGETGVRYFGTYKAHSEDRCIYLLRSAITEAASDLHAIQKIHDEQKTRLYEEIRQLRAAISDMERMADNWKRMYEAAQNANAHRQDALEADNK